MTKQNIIPTPPRSLEPSPREIRKWMDEVTVYLRTTQETGALAAAPVFLAGFTGDETAATDGVMLFDPDAGAPVVAIDGEWKKVAIVP